MRGPSRRTKEVREFILAHVSEHPKEIGAIAAYQFGVTRQAISRHLHALIEQGRLSASGTTRNRSFTLCNFVEEIFHFDVHEDLAEDALWRGSALPALANLKENVLNICQYGFTEMVNNVIAHSGSPGMVVRVWRNALRTRIDVYDEGIGVFQKIQNDFQLRDPRHALLELSKGKLTSDEARHSGEGLFFTSRMFDTFRILSGTLFFEKQAHGEHWLIDTDENMPPTRGTNISMEIPEDSPRILQDVFDAHAGDEAGRGFARTHVVLGLLRHGSEKLFSRSQAKRLLSRIDQFEEVVLDFNDIPVIGQAFADEIFRIFRAEHPQVRIHCVNTTDAVEKMIARTQA